MIKVAVLGTNFGKYHAQLYQQTEGFRLMGVFGRNENKLKEISRELNVRTTDRIEELIYDPEIDLIDVCLPTPVHSKWVIEALKNGKHVFCETPLSYSGEECEEIREASLKYGKFVYIDLFFKFSYPYMCAINKVKSGELGKILAVKSFNKTAPKWGDLGLERNISDFHVHNLDFVSELIGEPVKVTARGYGPSNQSTVVTLLEYEKCIAAVESSSNLPFTYPFSVGFEIIGEKGTLTFHGEYDAKTTEELIQYSQEGDTVNIPLKEIVEYEEVIKHIGKCIEQNIDSDLIGIDSAIKSLKICRAIWKSVQFGNTVQV